MEFWNQDSGKSSVHSRKIQGLFFEFLFLPCYFETVVFSVLMKSWNGQAHVLLITSAESQSQPLFLLLLR